MATTKGVPSTRTGDRRRDDPPRRRRQRAMPTAMAVLAALALVGALLVALTPPAAEAVLPGGDGPIAYTDRFVNNYEIYVMNPDGSGQTNLTNHPAADTDPAWSPDGTRIAFTSERDGNPEVYVMNADGSDQTRLTSNPADDFDPTWSPDGARIAFTTDRDENWEVYTMNANGSGQVNLTDNPDDGGAHYRDAAWSPVGSSIAFTSSLDGDWEVYSMAPGGGVPNQLTDNSPAGDTEPAWSPDGTKIAWRSTVDGPGDIWVMNANGGSQVNLTETAEGLASNPSWSSDGTKITFGADFDGADDVGVMNADGTGQTNITDHVLDDIDPSWGPPCQQSFGDVPGWVEEAVDWAFCERFMTGYPGNEFRPDDNITRAQVARLEYRIAGSPDVSALPDHGLEDVPGWVDDAVTWLIDGGFMTGYPDDTFRPDLPITRAQVTRLKYRVAGSPAGAPDHPFSDVPSWVDDAVDWIFDEGFATGYPDDTYRPNLSITRAQTTRMSCRIVDTVPC